MNCVTAMIGAEVRNAIQNWRKANKLPLDFHVPTLYVYYTKEIMKTALIEGVTEASPKTPHLFELCLVDNVEFVSMDVTPCKKPDGSEDWDKETVLVLDACGHLDAVYGSEKEYREYFKRAFPDAVYELIDLNRETFPISGTAIRNMKDDEERKKWIV